MPESIQLVGLDFGSTTSSAMIATASLLRNHVTGRSELGDIKVVFKSEPVFTPFIDETIDETRLDRYLDAWFAESRLGSGSDSGSVAGGAIITGLAAEKRNADRIVHRVRARFDDALIATADDPLLESWLAFMGACATLSLASPEKAFVNFDIGGGTTNVALGIHGDVLSAGSFWIGARHLQVQPGTYRITQVSRHGGSLLRKLKIRKQIGDELTNLEVRKIVDFYVRVLERSVSTATRARTRSPQEIEQARFHADPSLLKQATLVFSGGVGELIYSLQSGRKIAETTPYGDLGVDLASAILRSKILAKDLDQVVPENRGRATVYGLALHNTEISGSTLFLPDPRGLPLRDLPIIGALSDEMTANQVSDVIYRARQAGRPSCLRVDSRGGWEELRRMSLKIAGALRRHRFPEDQALVLLASGNFGKTLGNLVTDWGRSPRRMVAIDEIRMKHAQFVSLGSFRDGVVPVSFYGVRFGD